MYNMARIFLLAGIMINFLSCSTVYTEKQTEELSQVVYATKDSLDYARIDLADSYSAEAIRMVKPPKNRIRIEAIYDKPQDSIKDNKEIKPKQRVVVIPERYKEDVVVVVSTEEYDELLKDKDTFEQIKKEHAVLIDAKTKVDEELNKQAEYKDQMIKDLNQLQKDVSEKKLALLKCRIIIFGLLAAIAMGIYLRIKGIL